MNPYTPPATQVERLTAFIHLEERARSASSLVELGFIVTNETIGLVPYRQAILWFRDEGVAALSGIPNVDPHIPMVQWANGLCRHLHQTMTGATPVARGRLPPPMADDWPAWLPAAGFWLPLADGGLLLAREGQWSEGECYLLERLAAAYGHARHNLLRPGPWQAWRQRWRGLPPVRLGAAAVLVAAVLALPVRLSVLAPGEMVAAHPVLARAPLEGVIDQIHVQPNQEVAEGAPLFSLDATTLQSKLEVAAKTLATAEAEYRQSAQQAVWDAQSKSQLNIIAGRIEERQAEVAYLQELLARIQVKAPREGVVVFDDPTAWLGRPVALGEKVMVVTAVHDTEVEGWLAVGDDIDLPPGAPVTFFSNVDPLNPVRAQLRYLAYEAVPRPNGNLAFRLRATVAGEAPPRVGIKGTVRVDGESVSLAYWLLRKPLVALRRLAGL